MDPSRESLHSFNYYNGNNVIRFLVEKRNKQLQDLAQQFKIKISSQSLNHLEIQGDSNISNYENEIVQLLNSLTVNWKEQTISISNEWYLKIKKIYSSVKKSIILEYIDSVGGSEVRVNVCGIQGDHYESELNKIKNGESSDDSDTSNEDHDLYDNYLNIDNSLKLKKDSN